MPQFENGRGRHPVEFISRTCHLLGLPERSSKPERPRDVSQRAKMIVDMVTRNVDTDESGDKRKSSSKYTTAENRTKNNNRLINPDFKN